MWKVKKKGKTLNLVSAEEIQSYLDELCSVTKKRLDDIDERLCKIEKGISATTESTSEDPFIVILLTETGEQIEKYLVDCFEEIDGRIRMNVISSTKPLKPAGLRIINWPYYIVRPISKKEDICDEL